MRQLSGEYDKIALGQRYLMVTHHLKYLMVNLTIGRVIAKWLLPQPPAVMARMEDVEAKNPKVAAQNSGARRIWLVANG